MLGAPRGSRAWCSLDTVVGYRKVNGGRGRLIAGGGIMIEGT